MHKNSALCFIILALLLLSGPVAKGNGYGFALQGGANPANRAGEEPEKTGFNPRSYGGYGFSIQGGLNLANWIGNDMEETDFNTRFHIGAGFEIPYTKTFGFSIGAYYSEKGYITEDEFEGGEVIVTLTNTSQYIDIPVTTRIIAAEGLSFFFGPQFSYLLENTRTLQINDQERTESRTDDLRDLEIGATLGARYTFPFGLFLGASYERGFTSVEADGVFRIYNQAFKFNIGYYLRLY